MSKTLMIYPHFYYVFVPFHIVISVVITLDLIFGFLCTIGESGR